MKPPFLRVILLLALAIFFHGCEDAARNDYKAAVEAGDFDQAYSILNDYHGKMVKAISGCANTQRDLDDPILHVRDEYKQSYYKALLAYFDAFDYIYKAEIRLVLTTMEARAAADKITFLLSEIPVDGTKYPKGEYDNLNSTEDRNTEYYTFFHTYQTWSQHFNGLCDTVLMLAINRKNKVMAQQVLLHYADNVTVTHNGDSDFIDYTRTDALEAQKKYNDAVKMGLFN